MDDVQGDGIDHVLHNHSQHCVRPASLLQKNRSKIRRISCKTSEGKNYFRQLWIFGFGELIKYMYPYYE